MDKQKLRATIRLKRKKIPMESKQTKSALIFEKLETTVPSPSNRGFLIYLSSEEEVSSHQWVNEQIQKKIPIFAPRMNKEYLEICQIDSWDDLEMHDYGILEPKSQIKPSTQSDFDLILIPGVAFDKAGNRLGMGHGYYDRLLKQIKGPKIALAFEEQIQPHIPTEDHDVQMDLIITDNQIIQP
jgi:5-formyltetrahydrofolate cyclo-ligase